MKLSIRVAVVVAVAMVAPACGGPSTVQDLAKDVVSYLSAQDFKGFSENLTVTPQDYIAVCPQATFYQQNLQQHQDAFNKCLSKADWSTAEITNVLPNMGYAPTCGATVEYASDVKVTVTTRAQIYTFRIDNAIKTGDGWKLADHLSCD